MGPVGAAKCERKGRRPCVLDDSTPRWPTPLGLGLCEAKIPYLPVIGMLVINTFVGNTTETLVLICFYSTAQAILTEIRDIM